MIERKEEDKVNIKDFVLKSSLNILISELDRNTQESLLKLEPKLKENLKIKYFYDYANADINGLIAILKTKFSNEDSIEYANRLKDKSKSYFDALKNLHVNLEVN